MNQKIAVITGIGGMDAYHLTELLIKKDYKVIGIYRRTSTSTLWRLPNLVDYDDLIKSGQLVLEVGDITDLSSIARIIAAYQPTEFYNLAAQSEVGTSFKVPISTAEITGVGALVCLEAVRQFASSCKFYQASSSEMFGNVALGNETETSPDKGYKIILNESSKMIPRSPYGASKLFAHNMTNNYRQAYDMFAVNGILFNHSGPYRGEYFATRKITSNIAKILSGEQEGFMMGNIDSFRDEGMSSDYMRAAWMMLQQDTPKDYVISSEETHSIREFIQLAFSYVGIDDWDECVGIDPSLFRPAEIDVLIGDSTRAHNELGWYPEHTFEDLVYSMVHYDCLQKGVENYVFE